MGFWETTGYAVLLGAGSGALGQWVAGVGERRGAKAQFTRERDARVAERRALDKASRLDKLAAEIAELDRLTMLGALQAGTVNAAAERVPKLEPAADGPQEAQTEAESPQETSRKLRKFIDATNEHAEAIGKLTGLAEQVATQSIVVSVATAGVLDDAVREAAEKYRTGVTGVLSLSKPDREKAVKETRDSRKALVNEISAAHRRVVEAEAS